MADAPAPVETNPYTKAADQIRSHANWLLGAFAAVGAVFAAGLSIADISLPSDAGVARQIAAFGGVVVVIVGIAVAILAASGVATRRPVSIDRLADDEQLQPERDSINASERALLAPDTDIGQFRTRLGNAATAQEDAFTTYEAAQRRGAQEAELAPLRKNADVSSRVLGDLVGRQGTIVRYASLLRLIRAFKAAKVWMAVGVVVAAIGVVAFAWGSNPPEGPDLAAGEVLPKTPSDVVVRIDDDSRPEFARRLGAECDLGAVDAVATGATGDTYTVVTIQSDDCRSTLIRVGPDDGQVLRADAAEADAPEPTRTPPPTAAPG